MTDHIAAEYYSAGGNRNSAAADWSATSGIIAFGANQNVGLWSPTDKAILGVSALLGSHSDTVTSVRFLPLLSDSSPELLVTGSADGQLIVWKASLQGIPFQPAHKEIAHVGTVNVIAALGRGNIFATGGADGKVKLWRVGQDNVEALTEIPLKPRLIPLALALGGFATTSSPDCAFLIAGGTRNDVQVFSIEGLSSKPQVAPNAILTGHEAWIRSLALTPTSNGGYLLASASQDKYVRIWRIQPEDQQLATPNTNGTTRQIPDTITLTAKVQSVSAGDFTYIISFEALLLGHEDWIYSSSWKQNTLVPQLLTASADGSLSIWEPEESSGVWVSISRLGEISSQKGATTATGSSGGFWNGLWSPDGHMVISLGRTGSWRLWQYTPETQFWHQKPAISGHVGSVDGMCWAPDGSYLISTSSDQTTRLHAEWKMNGRVTWHEFSRPQIHGYDLNCIASTTPHQFVSGADEKLLRVFNEPKEVAVMLNNLCRIAMPPESTELPETAAIPVLGLSNKAIGENEDIHEGPNDDDQEANIQSSSPAHALTLLEEPPNEDLLSRHTLWPEHEKLYGHGYEISEVDSSPSGAILATACKASSIDHAVIRLYDGATWNEIKPPLTAHSLTVTRLVFSPQEYKYLLSVGRDRQWTVFKQQGSDSKSWSLVASNSKAHTRMILDCTWLPGAGDASFVTAGRDKVMRVWSTDGSSTAPDFTCTLDIKRKSAITALAAVSHQSWSLLASGEEDGTIAVHVLNLTDGNKVERSVTVDTHLCPTKSITRLAWRPRFMDGTSQQLAVASADSSVRILRFDWERILA
ncbi:hypothetical protein LTR84_000880 [Exophiala bonariae]|uniref:Elongator complex protein 2 n=1 Tax=Exophiala bonariae TaxID=1690606 RepID=A0AAV9NUD2_9EURO|nr:hypothetical protein LTR84_000880 [Exophiala bonariae]